MARSGMPRSAYRIVPVALLIVAVSAGAAAPPAIRVHPLRRGAAARASSPPAAADPRAAAVAERLRARLGGRVRTAAGAAAAQAAAIGALQQRTGADFEVHRRPDGGTPRMIRGALLQRAGASGKGADPDERTARAFLRTQRALLRLIDPDDELAFERSDHDDLGRRHLRFAQRHRGLPVWPAGLIVHLDPAGNVSAMDGAFVPTPRFVAGAPAIGAAQAADFARAAVAPGAVASAGELIVYAPGDHPARLAWKLTVPVGPAQRWLVVVDALSGQVLDSFNEVPNVNVQGSGVDLNGDTRALNVWSEDGLFFLCDTSKPMYDPTSDPPSPETTRGGIVIVDAKNQPPNSQPEDIPPLVDLSSDDPNFFQLPDGVSAAFALSTVYDYYDARHARNSIDGAGGTILAIVRLGRDYFNAFWSGSYMAFGDAEPFAGSLDAVAHELTHGVTQYTANLVYRDQSGALNEAFSDIFGEAIEHFATGSNDWQVGSQLTAPIRDMANPGRFGDPAKFSDFVVTDQDNGGVHTNSGIINQAFYQLTEGLDGGIGIGDAELIFYSALAFHLVANSRFVDARLACIAAARDLFGADSLQARRTAAAFDAVEISDGRGTPGPQPFPGVNGEDSTLFLFYDLEAGAYFLRRRENAQQDGEDGVQLVDFSVAPARPSVAGDGSFAAFVDATNDACLTTTDGSPFGEGDPSPTACLGFPGAVSSVAVSPDGTRFGFVLLNDEGVADNTISVIDLGEGGGTTTYTLVAPALDGGTLDTILFADSMEFTADGGFLIYDALNDLELLDGSSVQAWSIFSLDLVSGQSQAIVPPVPGLDIGYPSLSQRSDGFVVFDVFDSEASQSTVTTANLTTGAMATVATVEGGYGVPGYTGDDRAIVFSQASDTPTAFSLVRQPLAADRLTPEGSATSWLGEGDYSTIYRRGTFVGPGGCAGDCNGNGTVTIDELIRGVSIALGAISIDACTPFDADANGQVGIAELVAGVNAALDGC
jgi:Zn-dependent metalloprotease